MTVQIPDGVSFSVSGNVAKAKGPGGEIEKKFPEKVVVKVDGKNIEVACPSKALGNTFEAHFRNMVSGAKETYKKKMKIIFAHFPITVEVKGKDFVVKNFGGEKVPRKTKIVGNTKVEVKGQEVFISGPDKDAVGQTIGNIRSALKVKNRDPRVFQDGLYIVE
jgi:large subunit ribosomal protein L6